MAPVMVDETLKVCSDCMSSAHVKKDGRPASQLWDGRCDICSRPHKRVYCLTDQWMKAQILKDGRDKK